MIASATSSPARIFGGAPPISIPPIDAQPLTAEDVHTGFRVGPTKVQFSGSAPVRRHCTAGVARGSFRGPSPCCGCQQEVQLRHWWSCQAGRGGDRSDFIVAALQKVIEITVVKSVASHSIAVLCQALVPADLIRKLGVACACAKRRSSQQETSGSMHALPGPGDGVPDCPPPRPTIRSGARGARSTVLCINLAIQGSHTSDSRPTKVRIQCQGRALSAPVTGIR